MAKAKAAPMASTDVTVPRSVLKQFISLMDAICRAYLSGGFGGSEGPSVDRLIG